jgi:DNA repair protein RadA/Sms
MKPPRTVFACTECGAQSPKWLGRCPECQAWNSFVEETAAPPAPAGAVPRYGSLTPSGTQARLYADIDMVQAERLSTGIDEFDRVLGGGLVPGSLVLLGGEPGIGKSTLLLQAAALFAQTTGPVLYCSGEESEHQVKGRGERLGVGRAPLYLLAETCTERILDEVARVRPSLLIVDSIQTVFSSGRSASPPRSCCLRPRRRTCRRCSSATSPRTARWPGRRCSSTSSTRCCTSRANGTTPTASCAP